MKGEPAVHNQTWITVGEEYLFTIRLIALYLEAEAKLRTRFIIKLSHILKSFNTVL